MRSTEEGALTKNQRRMQVGFTLVAAMTWWFLWSDFQPSHGLETIMAASTTSAGAQHGALLGKVMSVDGAAVAGARVCAACAAVPVREAADSSCAFTDASGAYALRDLESGMYEVAVIAHGYTPAATSRKRAVMVLPAKDTTGVDFVLHAELLQAPGTLIGALCPPNGTKLFSRDEKLSAR